MYNHGTVTTFTGPGDESARGTGRVITTTFEVPGDAPPAPARAVSSTYAGSGDQVFVLNPNGEALDDTLYTLHLDDSSAEVYVIATAGNCHLDPQVERLDLREAAAKGLQAQPAVAEGDRIEFLDLVDRALVPATVRKVVTDGTRSWLDRPRRRREMRFLDRLPKARDYSPCPMPSRSPSLS